MTILDEFGGVLGQPLNTSFWTITISWSRLLTCVRSGPKSFDISLKFEGKKAIVNEGHGISQLNNTIYHNTLIPIAFGIKNSYNIGISIKDRVLTTKHL